MTIGGHGLLTLDGGGSSRRAVMQVTELRDGMGLHGLEGMVDFEAGGVCKSTLTREGSLGVLVFDIADCASGREHWNQNEGAVSLPAHTKSPRGVPPCAERTQKCSMKTPQR